MKMYLNIALAFAFMAIVGCASNPSGGASTKGSPSVQAAPAYTPSAEAIRKAEIQTCQANHPGSERDEMKRLDKCVKIAESNYKIAKRAEKDAERNNPCKTRNKRSADTVDFGRVVREVGRDDYWGALEELADALPSARSQVDCRY